MVPSSSKYKPSTPVEYGEVKDEKKPPGGLLSDQKEATQHREGIQTLMGPKTKAQRQDTASPLTGRTHRQRRRALLEATQNMAVKMPQAALSPTPAATSSLWISSETSALRMHPDRSKTKSTVSLQKQSASQTSRSVSIAKKSSPRLSDGEREATERNLPRRPVERRSDTGSSVVSMRTASSESRTSGEPYYEVTGQMRSTPLQGGPAFMTNPRNIKQGTSLPSVKPKCLARRLSEPTIPTTVSLTRSDILPIQPASRHPLKVPANQTCWGVIKTHQEPSSSSTPVLVTSDHEANNVAGLDPKSTRNHRSVRNKLEAGNEDGVDLAGDENDEHEEEEDDDDNKNLDQRVMTWLDGLDSATCRRFMRKQMAALQETDDAD